MRQFFQSLNIAFLTLAFGDALQDFQHALCANPAGGAFAAGFIRSKLQEEAGNVDHAVILIHDNQAARAHHGADCRQVIVVDRNIQVLCRDAAAGRTTRLRSLKLFAVGNATADIKEDLAQRRAHGDLHKAGIRDFAAQSENFGAMRFFCSHGRKPLGPI